MKNISVQINAVIIISAIILSCCNPNSKQSSSTTSIDREALDNFIREIYQTYPLPGLTVGVVTDNDSYVKSIGYSDLEKKIPLTDSTLLFMGQFSELLISTAMFKLQESGSISLEDNVVKHLPYFKTQGPYDKVNIHHLLTHTSGIPRFSPAWDMPSYEQNALEATTKSIVFQNLEFQPGSKRKESPYNYDIAADLIEKSEKISIEEFMKEKIFNALGMKNSSFTIKDIDNNRLAKPYEINDWLKYDFKKTQFYPYTRENAGSFGLHSTTNDMLNWMRMILKSGGNTAALLSDNSLKEFLKPCYQTDKDSYKGYGWNIFNTDKNTVYNNEWSVGGFSADLSLFPDKKTGIIVLVNTSGDFNPTIISKQLYGFLEGEQLEKVKTPVHIAMSRKLDSGKSIQEILEWNDSLMVSKNSSFITGPSELGQLGINLLRRIGRKGDAIRVFRYAVDKYPKSPIAHINLTEGLLAIDSVDEAEKHFKIALQLNPEFKTPYVNFIQEQITVAKERKL